MIEIIEVKKIDFLGTTYMPRIILQSEDDFFTIAKRLKIQVVFKKVKGKESKYELVCSDGTFLYSFDK